MNQNAFAPTTTALALLRRGFTLTTPDGRFVIEATDQGIVIFDKRTGKDEAYALTAAGLEAAINQRINSPVDF